MKKMFTFLVALSLLSAVQAQSGFRQPQRLPGQHNNVDRWDDNDRRRIAVNIQFDRDDLYNDRRISNERKRDMLIARINREYDQRIQRVRNNFFLSRWEKQRRIDFLQDQRRDEIREVYRIYGNRNHNGRKNRY